MACALAALFGVALVLPKPIVAEAAPAADGRTLFLANCAACHGEDARGRPAIETGISAKLPDFADCGFATREGDQDWLSTIHRGGRARAFVRNMPAFDKTLTEEEIANILGYLRSLCANSGYPRGDLNLPLAMFTEKAFPEDELVNETTINTKGLADLVSTTTLEKRFGKTGQLEFDVPVTHLNPGLGDGTHTGVGDITLGWKQNLYASVEKGSVFSLMGEAVLPTGDKRTGLGSGYTTFEAHALFGKTLGPDYFLQGDVFGEFPTGKGQPDVANVNLALGRTFAEDMGYGRAWTPQLEFLAAHDLTRGSGVRMDVVPQLQVSLSRLQHILFSAGYKIPLNDRKDPDHQPQFVFYFIWDWYDGGLFEGW